MKKLFPIFQLTSLVFMQFCFSGELFNNVFDEPTYPNHKIELMVQKPVNQEYQAIVFLHGAGKENGLKGLSPASLDYWLKKGYAVAAISLPGFGQSTGEKDFCGPFTMNSLDFAMNRIKKELDVSKFAIIGYGQGSLAAILLSTQRNDIHCIVCSNGGYDFLRHKIPSDSLFSILEKKGYNLDCNDEKALLFRSPIYRISEITAPIFILHRKGNPMISEKEAIDFQEAMIAAGKECHLVVKDRTPGSDEQKLSFEEILMETEFWLEGHIKKHY